MQLSPYHALSAYVVNYEEQYIMTVYNPENDPHAWTFDFTVRSQRQSSQTSQLRAIWCRECGSSVTNGANTSTTQYSLLILDSEWNKLTCCHLTNWSLKMSNCWSSICDGWQSSNDRVKWNSATDSVGATLRVLQRIRFCRLSLIDSRAMNRSLFIDDDDALN